jgi:glycosyltransferase involved in cell wall biosynthesis
LSTKLVVLTEIISPYRIPVFNCLARIEGIDLHVIFLAENDPETRSWLVYKNEIQFSYEVLHSYRVNCGRYKLLFNRGVCNVLSRTAPDVIVCGGYNYVASWQSLSWARRNGIPFLLWSESHARDRRRNNRFIERLKTHFIRRCSAFIVPGKAASHYLTAFHIARERIFVAPNAVDNDLFGQIARGVREQAAIERLQLGLPQRFFIFVGRLVIEKGVFDLLSAYRRLDPGIACTVGLVFVGDGPARTELEKAARDIAAGSIQFRGFVQREMLARYYALSDALVFPTHTDTWGLVVNEAMACGLPVVCADVAGCAADLIKEGWNGRVIRANDINQLTCVLEELITQRQSLAAMGENSRKRILDYSPEACAEGIATAALWRN